MAAGQITLSYTPLSKTLVFDKFDDNTFPRSVRYEGSTDVTAAGVMTLTGPRQRSRLFWNIGTWLTRQQAIDLENIFYHWDAYTRPYGSSYDVNQVLTLRDEILQDMGTKHVFFVSPPAISKISDVIFQSRFSVIEIL